MTQDILQKYNVPVPRYTSYPPANYFSDTFTNREYEAAIEASNQTQPEHISFYIHIPFCRHLCHYCGCNSFPMMKPEVVESYLAALHKEIDQVVKKLSPTRKIAQIHYGGGTPTALPVHRLKELNEHLLAGFSTIDRPEIAIECHPGYLDENYWRELTGAAFNRFSIGIQDFDEQVLKTVNRRPSLLPIEEIFSILRHSGARINMDFIYGLPHQTEASFADTIHRAAELRPDRLVTFSYAHVPWVNKQQLILEKAGLPAAEEKSRMYNAAHTLLTDTGYKPVGLDHFVLADDELYTALLDGQLHRNFQGYCTRRTTGQVYAFGVTGISQLSTAYTQNDKDIHQYIERINSGTFAISKGYALNRNEQITREVIETLMCNNNLNWQELANHLNLSIDQVRAATAYDEARLRELAADGIICYDDRHIQVTPEGSLFVRNVAATFDRLMLHTNKTFSKPV
ncbi:MAG: oxygen-independent coproporphyrinogen III oxidase [Tannerellaceae bacterium]